MTQIDVVVGGQYGSEAKGHVTQQLLNRHKDVGRRLNIRVAGPNAGHTVYQGNIKYPFQCLPVGCLDPDVMVMIAAGSEIDFAVLKREVEWLETAGVSLQGRFYIDLNATLLDPKYIQDEEARNMSQNLGSTSKGIGSARAARIMRRADTIRQATWLHPFMKQYGARLVDFTGTDPVAMLGADYTVIEGTQGFGLGLHNPAYPFTTSSDCRAIDFLAMAGISPWYHKVWPRVFVVARMFPIRVAGNSGPMYNEVTWAQLGLPEERTTVTKKVRRVGMWDGPLVREAVQANGGKQAQVVLTMVDQRFPEVAGAAGSYPFGKYPALDEFIKEVEYECGGTVALVTTSPTTALWRAL